MSPKVVSRQLLLSPDPRLFKRVIVVAVGAHFATGLFFGSLASFEMHVYVVL